MTQRTVNGAHTTYTVNDRNQVTGDGTYTYTYDAHGNRTGKSWGTQWFTYAYDDEQRLKSVETDTYGTPDYMRWKTEFVYDGRGRLRLREEYVCVSGAWSLNTQTRYVYDGMRVVQERNSANTPTVAYTRGLDLSSSLEQAGGIGGLLARSHGYSAGTWSTHSYYHADGNGNVTYLMASGQTMVATYKYDPYGRPVSQSGTLATANVYRFGSKEIHANSGLYYYGYRFYDPATQRWLNRDPIGERGGLNVYRFTGNSPPDHTDAFGLVLYKCTRRAEILLGWVGAQHVYLYDSATGQSCGEAKGGFLKGTGAEKQGDDGPDTPGNTCVEIPGGDTKAAAVMDCCYNKVQVGYAPNRHCHKFIGDCLDSNGLPDPDIYGTFYGPSDAVKDIKAGISTYCARNPEFWACRLLRGDFPWQPVLMMPGPQ